MYHCQSSDRKILLKNSGALFVCEQAYRCLFRSVHHFIFAQLSPLPTRRSSWSRLYDGNRVNGHFCQLIFISLYRDTVLLLFMSKLSTHLKLFCFSCNICVSYFSHIFQTGYNCDICEIEGILSEASV